MRVNQGNHRIQNHPFANQFVHKKCLNDWRGIGQAGGFQYQPFYRQFTTVDARDNRLQCAGQLANSDFPNWSVTKWPLAISSNSLAKAVVAARSQRLDALIQLEIG